MIVEPLISSQIQIVISKSQKKMLKSLLSHHPKLSQLNEKAGERSEVF